MAGRSLLKVLLVAVVFGSYGTQAQQSGSRYPPPNGPRDSDSVVFPADDNTANTANTAFLNRFNAEIPPPIRSISTPRCAMSSNGLSNSVGPENPCVADTDYNEDIRRLINLLLIRTNSVNEIVSDPMLRVILNDTLTAVPAAIAPATRFGGAIENPVCGAQEELIFPQRAKTPQNDWVFVLNQDNVKQALRVERCRSEGKSCDIGLRSREITTVCRQKYVYRRMLTLGDNNIQPEEVLMPSCCVCYVRRENNDIATRAGVNGTFFESQPVSTNQPPAASPAASPTASPGLSPINFGISPPRPSPSHQGSTSVINTRSNRNCHPFYPHGMRHC